MRRSGLLLLAILVPVAAQEEEQRVARETADAFARGDRARLTLLAAEPALKVSYPRVVEWLLRNGHGEAAQALARERQGPEADGLSRLVRSFRQGLFPDAAAQDAARRALAQLAKDPAATLLALDGLGPLAEGTLFAADVSFVRAKTLQRLDRRADALAEYERCAALARAVGEWVMVRDAEEERVALCTDGHEAATAADAFLAAAEKLDDRSGSIRALRLRARVRVALGVGLQRGGKIDEARLRWKAARDDLLAAADLAEKDGDRRTQGLCWRDVAVIWHVQEGTPAEALKIYDRAIQLLRGSGAQDDIDGTILNSAIVLTALGRNDDALARLDEILGEGRSVVVRPKALAQRALLLARSGRLKSAVPAYAAALAAAQSLPERVALLVDTGQLHLARQDADAALRAFDEALAIAPDESVAWAGKAFALGLRGDNAGAGKAFAGALAREGDRARRAALLLRAAQLRTFGTMEDAQRRAAEALDTFTDEKLREYGNAGAAWKTVADLTLLRGEHTAAEDQLGRAATLFYKLNDPSRAIDLYAQWMLLQLMLGKTNDASERLQVLRKMAETTPSDELKSIAKSAEAVYEARGGRGEHALQLLDEAEALAQGARDRLRWATALINRALLDPDGAAGHVRKALAVLDAERLAGPQERPLIQGYGTDWGPGIALEGMLASKKGTPEEAFPLLERALSDWLLVALRGRDAVLLAGLTAEQHAAYVDARAGLIEARALRKGVEEAEAAFDAMVARLRTEAPATAALAWPPEPPLADVQKALRKDEALVMTLFDPFLARSEIGSLGCVLIVDRTRVVLRRCGKPEKVIDDVAELLEAKQTVLLACGGPVGSFAAPARLRLCHVATAGSFLRQRTGERARGEGILALGPAPARFGKPADAPPARRLAMVYVDAAAADLSPLRLLAHPLDADGVVLVGDGALTLPAFALLARGAGNVVVGQRPPGPLDFFLEGSLDRKLPLAAACHEARAKGPLFFYGAPE